MAGTYSQMHIQLVFATKNHQFSFIYIFSLARDPVYYYRI